MGRLMCNCDAIMSSVNCPSDNILHVYGMDEIEAVLKIEPAIRLWDFRSKQRLAEYWYCSKCHRIHKVDTTTGRCILRYHPSDYVQGSSCLIAIPAGWRELCVITDCEMDAVTERDFDISLVMYIRQPMRRVFISPDHQLVTVFNADTGAAIAQYEAEAVPDPDDV